MTPEREHRSLITLHTASRCVRTTRMHDTGCACSLRTSSASSLISHYRSETGPKRWSLSVEDAAARSHNSQHEINARSLRGRLLLQNGEAHEAIERLRADPDAGVIPHWRGEYIASRAIALACVGKTMEARASADQADRTSGAGEVLLLAEAARAIASANE